ncbi:MAG: PIG-L family deacetylase [Acidobacteriota bacterium]
MIAAATGVQGRVLLGVFAHPDDESLACGGLMARCAALGAAVTLLCATRGEGGPGAESTSGDSVAARGALALRRTSELDAAARVLGISDLVVLDHGDGMLPWVEAARLEADIREAIERLRPDVVVTFGPDGLYWHPDHIAVYERTTAVVAAMTTGVPALYYVTMPPGQMRAVAAHAGGSNIVPGLDDLDAFGALAAPPTLVIDAGEFAVRKLAALRCHDSQMAAGPIARILPADAARLLGREHFRRAPLGASGPSFIDQFAAIVS